MLRRLASQLDMHCSSTQKAVRTLNPYGIHVIQGLKGLMQMLVVLCFC